MDGGVDYRLALRPVEGAPPNVVDVDSTPTAVYRVATAGLDSCLLTTGGGVLCWGGSLDQTTSNIHTGTTTPTATDGLGFVTDIRGYEERSFCVRTIAGVAECWGKRLNPWYPGITFQNIYRTRRALRMER